MSLETTRGITKTSYVPCEVGWFDIPPDQIEILKKLELIGRVCYKSEDRITPTSAKPFVKGLITRGHESVLEHVNLTVVFICDRGVTHELVRHRIAAYSQESTRYCNYGGMAIRYIDPKDHMTAEQHLIWRQAMLACSQAYNDLIAAGCQPQMARSVLPNSLKTEIVTTMNLREWRHVLRLRVSKKAHPQMREMMGELYRMFNDKLPMFVEDISYEG